jgi:hypothetical protein
MATIHEPESLQLVEIGDGMSGMRVHVTCQRIFVHRLTVSLS